jgi:hypothetical protein
MGQAHSSIYYLRHMSNPRRRYWILTLRAYGCRPILENLPYQFDTSYRKAYWNTQDNTITYLIRLHNHQKRSYFKVEGLLEAIPASYEDFLDYNNTVEDNQAIEEYLGESGSLHHGATIHNDTHHDQSTSGQQHLHRDNTNISSKPTMDSIISELEQFITNSNRPCEQCARFKRDRDELEDKLGQLYKQLKTKSEPVKRSDV